MTRRRLELTAPAGLRAAFSMINLTGYAAAAATVHANCTYTHACRIVDEIHSTGDETRVLQELQRAAASMFRDTDQPPHLEPSMGMTSAFHTGFAVCWLLMMAVNGKDGRR